jgi:hypothetical protein
MPFAGDPITADDYTAELDTLNDRVTLLEEGWESFTPTWSLGLNSVTLGNGTRSGRYRIDAGTVNFYAELVWGSTTAWPLNDSLNLLLPVPAFNGNFNGRPITGIGAVYDTDLVYPYQATLAIGVSDNRVVFRALDSSDPFDGDSPLAVWASGDTIWAVGTYEVG